MKENFRLMTEARTQNNEEIEVKGKERMRKGN